MNKSLASRAGGRVTWSIAKHGDALALAVADRVEAALKKGLAERDAASLVVPGGRTPTTLFEILRHRDLAWEKIHVTLTDDRWVAPGSAHSNETLVKETLFQDKAAKANFVGLKRDGATPEETLAAVCADIAAMPRPFDAVVLGIGGDGHFASLFPSAEGVEAALDPTGETLVCAITPDPLPDNAPYARISLTARALFDAWDLIIIATGSDKRAVLERAIDGTAAVSALPVRAVMDQTMAPVTIGWSE